MAKIECPGYAQNFENAPASQHETSTQTYWTSRNHWPTQRFSECVCHQIFFSNPPNARERLLLEVRGHYQDPDLPFPVPTANTAMRRPHPKTAQNQLVPTTPEWPAQASVSANAQTHLQNPQFLREITIPGAGQHRLPFFFCPGLVAASATQKYCACRVYSTPAWLAAHVFKAMGRSYVVIPKGPRTQIMGF